MPENYNLFDKINHRDNSFRRYSEPYFQYWNKSSRPILHFLRRQVENWFTNYKASNDKKARLWREFRSDKDREHLNAFFELYLHNLFCNLGYMVEVEPKWINGTKPDFLISKNETKILVEATGVYPEAIFGTQKQLEARLIDEIDKRVKSPNFLLQLIIADFPNKNQNPPISQICKCLERQLALLDPDVVTKEVVQNEKSGLSVLPIVKCRHDSWNIEFRAIPKKPERRGSIDTRVIGMQSWGVYSVDDVTPIRNSVNSKSSYYGNLDIPFILAMNIFEQVEREEHIIDALFGSEAMTISSNGDIAHIRQHNGSWFGPKGYEKTRMSGVLAFHNLQPHMVGLIEPTLWHHPKAQYPIDVATWNLKQQLPSPRTGKIATIQKDSVTNYLGFNTNDLNELLTEE